MFVYRHKALRLEDIKDGEENTLHIGWAAFDIIKIENKISNAGNQMAVFTYQCINEDGGAGRLWENVPLTENCEWRLARIYKSVGAYEFYKSDDLDLHFLLRKKGSFVIGTEFYQGKEKLVVDKFIYPESQAALSDIHRDLLNDDIPF